MSADVESPRAPRDWAWAAVGPIATLVAFHGAFSLENVYYVRDLTAYFWGEHLWLRHELFAGTYPLWDPYVAFGQPAISDPNRGLLFPPTLLLRVLLPEALGFNMCLALAFPVLALGLYCFLRRHVSAPAAALGSVAFALSGPSISMGNFFNFPWAFAFVPWALYGVDLLVERATARRFAGLAVAYALIFLAGEAVTLIASAALTAVYGAVVASGGGWRARTRAAMLVSAAGAVGLMLAAVQALPLAETIGWSVRALEANERIVRIWSLHPLTLVEALVSQPFGDPIMPSGAGGAWLKALNSNREPLVFSIYLGIGTLALGMLGALVPRSRRFATFWLVVGATALVCALGEHTPIYPMLQRVLPVLESVRYPSKYVVFLALAAAMLAAVGWDSLAAGRAAEAHRAVLRLAVGIPGAIAGVALAITVWVAIAPASFAAAIMPIAEAVGIFDPARAGTYAATSAMLVMPRLFALAAATAACIAWGVSPQQRRAHGFLVALVLLDLLVVNANLIPTVEASLLGRPEWVVVTREHPADRTYVAGRLSSSLNTGEQVDMPFGPDGLPVTERPATADIAVLHAFLASIPGAWQVRDSASYDNSVLFPRAYWDVIVRLRESPLETRARFLGRTGVRYFLVPWESLDGGAVRLEFPDHVPLRLLEREPEVTRARVVAAARVEPEWKALVDGLFAADRSPATEVLVSEPSSGPSGGESAPCPASASIVEDATHVVRVRACAPDGGGYLVLLDSFDPNWVAEVDGAPAPILRADGLFRAVHLRPGAHDVNFVYRPRRFWIGAAVSAATALVLLGACVLRRRRLE